MIDFEEAYLNGINFRKELTNKTPREITIVMDKIYQMIKDKYEYEKLDEYYHGRKTNLTLGAEVWEKGKIEEEYILQEVIVTWGGWNSAKIKLDCFGIKAFIKYEHENEKLIWDFSWTQFKKLNELFPTK